MGAFWDLFGLAVFGEDIRPNQRSKSPIWSILVKLISYSVILGGSLVLFAPITVSDTNLTLRSRA